MAIAPDPAPPAALSPLPAPLPAPSPQDRFAQSLPKVELLVHLLGTVRPDTLAELARRAQVPMQAPGAQADPTAEGSVDRMARIDSLCQLLNTQLLRTTDDLTRITFEALQDLDAHNVRYAELHWEPQATVSGTGLRYADALAAIVRGLRDAERKHGIQGRVIATIGPHSTVAQALQVVRWMMDHRHELLLGLHLDIRPELQPDNAAATAAFAPAFALARQAGYRCSAQVGGDVSPLGLTIANLREAIDTLHCDRLHHALALAQGSPEALDLAHRCAQRGIVVTVQPLLPAAGATTEHPIHRLAERGLKIHPHTAHPALLPFTPSQAWAAMHQGLGLDPTALRHLMHTGLDAAWTTDTLRRRLRTEFDAQFDAALTVLQLAQAAASAPKKRKSRAVVKGVAKVTAEAESVTPAVTEPKTDDEEMSSLQDKSA